jgi:hypothetical protein
MTTKRAFLRGAAAVAAGALPAGAALASGHNPDAALLALQGELNEADQAWEILHRKQTAAEDAYFAIKPRKPDEPCTPSAVMDAFWAGDSRPLIEVSKSPNTYDEAMVAWRKATEQAERESGLKAAEDAVNAADAVRLAIRDEKIIPTRAKTLTGLIWKARYAAAHFPGEFDEEVLKSIAEDLLAMAGET